MSDNVDLLKQIVTSVQKKNDKEQVNDTIRTKPAKVIGVDEETYKVFVYFLEDTEQKEYTFYNKSGEILSEGDTVKVFYTTNVAKGWIGARNGEPVYESKKDEKNNHSILSSYEYLTDTSVNFNGMTYTIEKDESTGLISKISDSVGNKFTPTLNSGITDIATHNAVFWAVAMCRGISGRTNPIFYDRGNQFVDTTGGWEFVIRPDTLYETEFRSDCIYQKTNGWTSSTINYNYVFAQTIDSVDLTDYKVLHIRCKNIKEINNLDPKFGVSTIKITSSMTTGNDGASMIINSSGEEKTFDLDISRLSGNFYIYVRAAEYNTIYTYKIWAE